MEFIKWFRKNLCRLTGILWPNKGLLSILPVWQWAFLIMICIGGFKCNWYTAGSLFVLMKHRRGFRCVTNHGQIVQYEAALRDIFNFDFKSCATRRTINTCFISQKFGEAWRAERMLTLKGNNLRHYSLHLMWALNLHWNWRGIRICSS